jgi:DNA-binding GntR family transcriptional regulator
MSHATYSVERAQSLRSQAATQLRQHIVTGTLAPGSLHSEQSIAAQMGISRTPVREALLQLASEGLVESIPQRGVRVLPLDPAHLAQILEFRAAIEGYCAHTLALDPRPEVLTELDAELRRQREIIGEGDRLRWVQANMNFHQTLVRSLGNRLMDDMMIGLGSHTMRIGYRMIQRSERMQESLMEHTAIVEAIRKRSPTEAQSLASKHLYVTEVLMRQMFNDLGSGLSGAAARQA